MTLTRIASFDIGIKNFAFCIEEFNQKELESLSPIPKNHRFKFKGGVTDIYSKFLKNIYLNGKILVLKNLDISENCDKDKYLDSKVFLNLTHILDEHGDEFDQCSIFIIEKQMSFGKGRAAKINTRAIKVGQHVLSYFTIRYMGFKSIIEFPAYHKTQLFGVKLGDKERKKWATEKAIEILTERNENNIIEEMNNHKKTDDMSDTILQLQAFKYLHYIEKTY